MKTSIIAALVAGILCLPVSHATLITNGNFEAQSISNDPGALIGLGITDWGLGNTQGSEAPYLMRYSAYSQTPIQNNFVLLGGGQWMAQTLGTLQANTTYTVSVDFLGAATSSNQFLYGIGLTTGSAETSALAQNYVNSGYLLPGEQSFRNLLASAGTAQTLTFSFTTKEVISGPSPIIGFYSWESGSAIGPAFMVDNATVAVHAVPEASSFLMMLGGLSIVMSVTRGCLRGLFPCLLMGLLALAGCATPPSTSTTTAARLEKGMTVAQVRAAYGNPTRTTVTSDGTSWLYTTAQPANPLSAFTRPKILMINFGRDGRILYFSNSGY